MRIPVFYSDAQVHDAGSFSKSPLKPGMLARKIALDPDFEIKSSLIDSVASDRLAQTHELGHVKALIAGEKADGFGNLSKKNNKAVRATVGNFLAAAEWAAAGRRTGNPATDIIHPGVVWSLTSGFHHAGHDFCGGFCTFEALTLAAFELHKYRAMKTLIIDEDAHYGNGCMNIIMHKGMENYCEYMQSNHTHSLPCESSLTDFTEQLESMLVEFMPNIIMYQAGADNWIGDPLGGALTMERLFLRDKVVFRLACKYSIPVVVNLAGGYADNFGDTLAIHMNTGVAMKQVYLNSGERPVYPGAALALEEIQ